MSDSLHAIYTAESLKDAQLLRDQLAADGVPATLVRGPFGRAGADASQVQVLVPSKLEPQARKVLGRLEHRRLEAAGRIEVLDAWPRCPECNAPRVTRCPVCQTAGHDFPQADPEFSVLPSEGAAEEPPSCGCGGCGALGPAESPSEADQVRPVPDDEEEFMMLTCTTCDEPFVPQFLQRCEWCGHEFPDGLKMDLPDDPVEPMNARVVFVFLMLAAGLLAVLAWFAYLW